MSNQDMQFADPEWRPPEQKDVNVDPREQETVPPRPINADRREQPQWQPPPPQQQQGYMGPGYAGPQPQMTWGRRYGRPYRRRSPWFWIILAFIIIALMSGAFRGFGGGDRFGPQNGFKEQPQNFTFPVSGVPDIMINSGVGNINVHTDSSNTNVVSIQETTGGDPLVKPTKNGNTITLNIGQGDNNGPSRDISLDVTVPSNADLQLQTTSGSIDVEGVNLTGSSSLISNGGEVTFNGSLGSGNYQFQSTNGSGSVNVTLPSNSNFHVDASTNNGSINSSDFSSVKVQNHGSGTEANGDVGTAKQATVTLQTDTGSISLHKSS